MLILTQTKILNQQKIDFPHAANCRDKCPHYQILGAKEEAMDTLSDRDRQNLLDSIAEISI